MADDCTFNDLPAYGGANAKTPNLDALARQSMVFDRAYLCSAMCQPCRAELYSGQYPLRNGCAWNHSASRPMTKSLPHYLGDQGYRVGLAGKVHVAPAAAFPFESVAGFEKNCVRDPTRDLEISAAEEFMSRADAPFCLIVALVEPHVPWVMGDPKQYPPAKIQLPPNLADTPLTRTSFGRYLAEISYMDNQVGQVLDTLEQSGKSKDTIVIFTSEQGAQFPGCKWTNFDTGVHTALFVRWPGKIPPGRKADLVQYADVAPTLVELSGGDPATLPVDGMSFKNVLLDEGTSQRDYVYGMHNNIPEGPAFPIRSISDGRYHYIRNLTPKEIYIEKHLMGVKGDGKLNNPYWQSWVWESANSQRTYDLVKRYTTRPPEQLFDLEVDPYEMNNLAGNPQYANVLARLSTELDEWMALQGDPGIEQDLPETHAAAKRGHHQFFPPK